MGRARIDDTVARARVFSQDIFCTPKELREMFDFTLVDAARKRLGGDDAFPEIYDKVRSEDGISDLSAELAAEQALAAAGKPVAGGKKSL